MNGTIDADTIARAQSDYPALSQLFGGYFHQDWQQDHASRDAALQAFVRDASPDTAGEAAGEIDRLLGTGFDDNALARMLTDGFDCNYMPESDGISPAAWLGQVRDTLRAPAA